MLQSGRRVPCHSCQFVDLVITGFVEIYFKNINQRFDDSCTTLVYKTLHLFKSHAAIEQGIDFGVNNLLSILNMYASRLMNL